MKLKNKLDELGISITELIKRCNVNRSTIYAIINHTRNVKRCTYGKIAKALGCSIDEIMD